MYHFFDTPCMLSSVDSSLTLYELHRFNWDLIEIIQSKYGMLSSVELDSISTLFIINYIIDYK